MCVSYLLNFRLDVYLPAEAPVEEAVLAETNGSNGSRPVVVFVHGGIWATGSKELFSNLGVSLASHGVITLILQYTLFPEVKSSLSLSPPLSRIHTRTHAQRLYSQGLFDNSDYYGKTEHMSLQGNAPGREHAPEARRGICPS